MVKQFVLKFEGVQNLRTPMKFGQNEGDMIFQRIPVYDFVNLGETACNKKKSSKIRYTCIFLGRIW